MNKDIGILFLFLCLILSLFVVAVFLCCCFVVVVVVGLFISFCCCCFVVVGGGGGIIFRCLSVCTLRLLQQTNIPGFLTTVTYLWRHNHKDLHELSNLSLEQGDSLAIYPPPVIDVRLSNRTASVQLGGVRISKQERYISR